MLQQSRPNSQRFTSGEGEARGRGSISRGRGGRGRGRGGGGGGGGVRGPAPSASNLDAELGESHSFRLDRVHLSLNCLSYRCLYEGSFINRQIC